MTMKLLKASQFDKTVEFGFQDEVPNDDTGMMDTVFVTQFKRKANLQTIFREQLEFTISNSTVYRQRYQVTLRYCDELIQSNMLMKYNGKLFSISIVGDTRGDRRETRLLAETILDGGR